MLTERERAQLAPHLTRMHALLTELAAAERETTAAEQRLDRAKEGAGWRERAAFGIFSRDPERARTYQDAHRARARAAASAARTQKEITRLDRQIEALIEPMMPRLDPGYVSCTDAIEQCDRAVRKCRVMRERIAGAGAAVQAATRSQSRDETARRRAEIARQRYTELVAEAKGAATAVQMALEAASRAVRAAGGKAPLLKWDTTRLERLPRAGDGSARHQLARARVPLRELRGRLDHAIATVTRWRAETKAAQARLVAAARARLVDESR